MAAALVDDSLAFFFSEYFLVALDILMAGGGDAGLRVALVDCTLDHRRGIERLWLEKFVEHGWSLGDAEDVLALTMSLARGFAIRALVEPRPERYAALAARWLELLRAAGVGPATVEDA